MQRAASRLVGQFRPHEVVILIRRTFLVAFYGSWLICSVLFNAGVLAANEKGSLSVSDNGLSAGYVSLSFQNPNPELPAHVEMKGPHDADWRTIYEGPDTATTLSGLESGVYQFRLSEGEDRWSAPLELTVRHHSLTKAFGFFSMGLLLFVVLLVLIFCAPPVTSRQQD